MGVLDQRFEKNFMITSVDYVFNWRGRAARSGPSRLAGVLRH